jgi:hypothetical protein
MTVTLRDMAPTDHKFNILPDVYALSTASSFHV